MRKFLIVAVLPLVAFVTVPGTRAQAQQQAKTKVNLLDTTDGDYTALGNYKGVTGKVLSVSPDGKIMTVRVEYQVQEPKNNNPIPPNPNPNPNPTKGMMSPQQIQHELDVISRIKNPNTQQQRLTALYNKLQNQAQTAQNKLAIQQIQQYMKAANNFKTVTYAKDFDLPVLPKARVVKKSLGLEYDDKGNIKEYTDEELKKLKDDVYTQFYKSKMDEVAPGETVYIALAKPKKKTEKKKDGGTENSEDAKAKEDDKGKVDDKTKEKAKPEIDIADLIGEKGPGTAGTPSGTAGTPKLTPTAIPADAPRIEAIVILSEVIQTSDQGSLPPIKKKKKDNNN